MLYTMCNISFTRFPFTFSWNWYFLPSLFQSFVTNAFFTSTKTKSILKSVEYVCSNVAATCKTSAATCPVQPGPAKLSQTFMNCESNHEECRMCSCVGPNTSKRLTGALGWPAADKWITSCENSTLHTEAEKITAHADEKESNFFHPSKSSHTETSWLQCKYKWGVCLRRCI